MARREADQFEYHFDWLTVQKKFLLTVSEALYIDLLRIDSILPYASNRLEQFGFEWIGNNLETGFGYVAPGCGSSPISFINRCDKYVAVTIDIPSLPAEEFVECHFCHGSGKIGDGSGSCSVCKGRKQREVGNNLALFALSATLNRIFYCAHSDKSAVYGQKRQLIDIQLSTSRGNKSNSVNGYFHVPLMNYLRSDQAVTAMPIIENAMRQAYYEATKEMDYPVMDEGDFLASTDMAHQFFYLSCPSCDFELYTGACRDETKTKGIKFHSNKFNEMAQQMSLLAGLAALCGAARNAVF